MDKKQTVLFMAGFPRAGSTLLMNILAQNPKFLGTPTSGLVASVLNLRDSWKGNDIYKSNGEEYIYPRIKNTLKYMIIGFYANEVSKNIIAIDKNRAWTGHLPLLEEIFNCKIKIIYPIRHIGDCIISMERINRKSTPINHGDNGNWINEQTTIGRAENFIKDDGVFGMPLLFLRETIYRKMHDRLVMVPYDDMLNMPEETFNRIYDELGLPRFSHDFNNIKQTIVEQDLHHGFAPNSLHKIKEGRLGKPNPRDNSIFLGDYIEKVEKERFGDITDYINNLTKTKKI